MKFNELIKTIQQTHSQFHDSALHAVNRALTIRNWLIGFYIVEYEQAGEDRAKYGENLIEKIAQKLSVKGLKGYSSIALRTTRSFYLTYPQIQQTVSAILTQIRQTASVKFKIETRLLPYHSSHGFSDRKENNIQNTFDGIQIEKLLDRLSYSHFIEILKVDSGEKRSFYEIETIKNNWSVRELKRAIDSLLYERTGLSTNKKAIISKVKNEAKLLPADTIKNPYLLEFLGLAEKPEFSESDLETAIIDNLQKFLMEMGRGFCFEARQKRITFGNKHYFIDLVFYHRILKCHVLIDLKIGEFDHADAGQMNLYLNYYRDNEMMTGDNVPIGLILCASKNNSLVQYALGGLSHEIFVAKYLIELPSSDKLEEFIRRELNAI